MAADTARNPYRNARLRDGDLDAWEDAALQVVYGDHSYALTSLTKADYARRVAHLAAEVRYLRQERDAAQTRQSVVESRLQRVKHILEGGEDA